MPRLATVRFEMNHISAFRSDTGEITNNPKQINLILDEGLGFLYENTLPSETPEQMASLEEVTEAEVEVAIKHLAIGKPPGPNGYTRKF